jgi:hypothetical protein
MMEAQALTYIEIDVPVCTLTYGTSPCTASIPDTGDIKCFNSRVSCQDRDNYSENEVTFRFAKPVEYLPASIDCIPSIVSVDFSPAIVSLGGNLGQRASLTVTFRDHPHSDTGEGYDKYLADRDYDPFSQGTYWGKFRARQPFLRGRRLRWITGLAGQTLEEMKTYRFFIESFTGPTPDGKYTIVAKDTFKLADGDRAQAPRLSSGFLSADIASGDTAATLLPSGVGNAEYPASGLLCIGGNEVVSFTRSGNSLTITRAQKGTVAKAHKAQDRVQVVLSYTGEDVADILYDLLVNYAGVSSASITLPDWQAETAAHLGNVYTTNICEPTSVATLCSELIEQAALALWDDLEADQLRLQVLRAIVTNVQTFSPENRLSLQIKDQPDKRLSEVQVYFGQIDPTRPLSNLDNYRSTGGADDEDAAEDYGSAAIKTITSRWIPEAGRSIADRLGDILLGRFRDPPRALTLQLQRYAGTDVALGIGYRAEHPSIQDATGAPANIPFQVTRYNPGEGVQSVEGEEMLWSAPATDTGTRTIDLDANRLNINLRTEHDSIYRPAQSGDVVNVYIRAGVTIGSAAPSLRAFDVGSWPSGVIINIYLDGNIAGAGGLPGVGGSWNAGSGSNGGAGGLALYTRYPINLARRAGSKLWSGGGGGGGGGGTEFGLGGAGGGGGGGGGGVNPGNGGSGGAQGGNFGDPGSPGSAGTSTAGGAPGSGGSTGFGQYGGVGGAGGNPGQSGANGVYGQFVSGSSGGPPGAGGAAGASIDGVSYVTVTDSAGDIRGSQIN